MKYLLFSHGFGVRKDSKGMFSDIAQAFSGYQAVMFEYNSYSLEGKLMTVPSYRQQARNLSDHIKAIYSFDSDAEIILIAHSQGSIMPGLIKNIKLSKAILLAPPSSVSARRSKQRPNRKLLKSGAVMIFKNDGSQILLSTRFMLGLRTTRPIKLYSQLAKQAPTFIIAAKQDEMVRNSQLSAVTGVKLMSIEGNHNFTGTYRKGLIKAIAKILIGK